MNCYYCEKGEHPGGTLYDVRPTIGVCQHCGVGVCQEHGTKAEEVGSRLLCADCTQFRTKTEARAA